MWTLPFWQEFVRWNEHWLIHWLPFRKDFDWISILLPWFLFWVFMFGDGWWGQWLFIRWLWIVRLCLDSWLLPFVSWWEVIGLNGLEFIVQIVGRRFICLFRAVGFSDLLLRNRWLWNLFLEKLVGRDGLLVGLELFLFGLGIISLLLIVLFLGILGIMWLIASWGLLWRLIDLHIVCFLTFYKLFINLSIFQKHLLILLNNIWLIWLLDRSPIICLIQWFIF